MNLLNSLKTLALALILSVGIGYAYAAWAPPTNPPTGGNAEAPVNVGSATQLKAGGLAVNGLLYAMSKLGIGDSTPDGSLLLDVEGSVGATAYCDEDGTNCTPATALGGGAGGTPLSPEFIKCQVSPGVGSCSVACTAGRVIIAYGLEGTSQDADYTTHSASVSGGNTLNVSQGSMNNEYARYVATCVNPIFAAGGDSFTNMCYCIQGFNNEGGLWGPQQCASFGDYTGLTYPPANGTNENSGGRTRIRLYSC